MYKTFLVLVVFISSLLLVSCSSNNNNNNTRGKDTFTLELSEETLKVFQGQEGQVTAKVESNLDLEGIDFSLRGNAANVEFSFEEGKGGYNLKFKVNEKAKFGTKALQVVATLAKNSDQAKLNLIVSNKFEAGEATDFFTNRGNSEKKEVPGKFVAKVRGKGKLTNNEPEDEFEAGKSDENDGVKTPREDDKALPKTASLIAFDVKSKDEFEIELNGSFIDEVHKFQVKNGHTKSSKPDEKEPQVPTGRAKGTQLQPQKILGVDTRVRLTATTAWPWRTITQFTYNNSNNSGCSGTFIGRRIVITAAHCINRRGTSTYYNFRITPGRNGTGGTPYGSIQVSTSNSIFYTPTEWRNSNECRNSQTSCRRWDWGLIVLPPTYNNQTGWMGYWYMNGGSLSQKSIYNRGYPECGNSHSPASCVLSGFYGDTKTCSILSYLHTGSDGWNDFILHNCDTSSGHSGSPMYMYVDAGAVVTAVHGYGYSTSNGARRLGPSETSIISLFRNWFP